MEKLLILIDLRYSNERVYLLRTSYVNFDKGSLTQYLEKISNNYFSYFINFSNAEN